MKTVLVVRSRGEDDVLALRAVLKRDGESEENGPAEGQSIAVFQGHHSVIRGSTASKKSETNGTVYVEAAKVGRYGDGVKGRPQPLRWTWADIDFEDCVLHVRPRKQTEEVFGSRPKDHERREIPIPKFTVDLLAELQVQAPERVPYLFMTAERYDRVQEKRAQGWRPTRDLFNNMLRGLKNLCRRAQVATEGQPLTWHAIRETCTTNWAKRLPANVAKELAGHASITTTDRYYLRVTQDQRELTRQVMQGIVAPKPTH